MHHTSEITPFIELRLWKDKDIPQLAKMADRLEEHSALAGIQLAYSGIMIIPSAYVSDWSRNTLEQAAIHRRLIEVGVTIVLNRGVTSVAADHVVSNCVYTDKTIDIQADAVVMVTSRQMNDEVWLALQARESEWLDAGIRSVKVIGDAQAPGPIAWATYAGHRFARELDVPDIGDQLPFRREITQLHLETS